MFWIIKSKKYASFVDSDFAKNRKSQENVSPRVRYTIGISSSAIAPRFLRFPPALHEIWNKEITEIYEKNRSNIEACE